MKLNRETKGMNRYFAKLNEENKKKVLEMTKFMILAQDSIAPAFFDSYMENKAIKRILDGR